jgi:uncharacterized membrane protein YgcG
MRTFHRLIMVVAAVLLTAVVAQPRVARAAAAEVVDNAGFFSEAAVSKANERLADIAQRTGRDLRIETYPAIPDELKSKYAPDRQAQFFADWAEQRGKQAGVRGVLVLVCKDPAFLTVQVGRQTRQSGVFTDADKNRMRDTLAGAFKAKNYDAGLAAIVEQFDKAVQNNAPSKTAPPAAGSGGTPPPYRFPSDTGSNTPSRSSGPVPQPTQSKSIFGGCFGTFLLIVLIIGGIMLVRRIFGGRRSYGPGYGAGQRGYPPAGGYGPGYGGGFGGGILGGLLGGWLGNRVLHDSTAQGAPPPADTGGGGWNEPPPAPPQEFGGSGDASGGASFGGGSDFGGGGGGGDFGGGGGDSSGGASF